MKKLLFLALSSLSLGQSMVATSTPVEDGKTTKSKQSFRKKMKKFALQAGAVFVGVSSALVAAWVAFVAKDKYDLFLLNKELENQHIKLLQRQYRHTAENLRTDCYNEDMVLRNGYNYEREYGTRHGCDYKIGQLLGVKIKDIEGNTVYDSRMRDDLAWQTGF